MKKRTACFGWTKRFQRTVAKAGDLMRSGQHNKAGELMAFVKAAHIARVKQLRGVA
ncbi:hypothetical protein [Rhodanobacter lindaniclasticus]|uniref:hypothetical protein n=1 Tax=Rhodanobacter lindaniclasticus TaxID=75310 RepID=UPI0014462454|nr:hypothetical protein [Rhodanobacter lindaniclasticus]